MLYFKLSFLESYWIIFLSRDIAKFPDKYCLVLFITEHDLIVLAIFLNADIPSVAYFSFSLRMVLGCYRDVVQ